MGRRPKRRCVTARANVPSAVHYVGYVEDEETPEMIMRKFEELNKVGARVAFRIEVLPSPSSNSSSQPTCIT